MKIFSKFYILLYWTLFVLILITIPMPEYDGYQISYYDKLVHVFLFGVFNFLLFRFLSDLKRPDENWKITISLSASIIYSALTEYIQFFVPGRDTNELDFLAGILGALAVSVFIYSSRIRRGGEKS